MKWLKRALVLLLLLLLLVALMSWRTLSGSLPALDGSAPLAGLGAPVQVQRDALGVPTLSAANRLDLARATGYLHAQDRYFQMDLTRRLAAGELAELVGQAVLGMDRKVRVHRLRAVAAQIVAASSAEERALMESYVAGVNAGLAALKTKPFEYWLLRAEPRPWTVEDSILTVLSMWLQLTDEVAERDAMLHALHEQLPPALYAFITQGSSAWDAPLEGGIPEAVPVPGPEIYDLRTLKKTKFRRDDLVIGVAEIESAVGSNAWAVAAAHTAVGGALIADDMHLGLGVPNTWYRLRLQLQPPQTLDVTGVSLPGTPFVVAGSNSHVAWGFTNSYGDWSDLALLQPAPGDRSRYRTPQGFEPFELFAETIKVRGGDDVTLNIKSTIWGPVVGKDADGRDLAVRWLGAEPGATNMRLAWLEQARTLEETMAVANGAGVPPQNFVVADRAGRVGWTLAGRIQSREGYDPARPANWAEGGGWTGWLPPERYPRVVDPASGRIWTANARLVDGEALQILGDGGYEFGARAQQIRGALLSIPQATAADMLQLQLDDRALFMTRWQSLLLESLRGLQRAQPEQTRIATALEDLQRWNGRASVDSTAYRLIRDFHDRVRERAFDAITAALRKRDPSFHKAYLRQWEGALLQLIDANATHLIDPAYADVPAFLQAMAQETLDSVPAGETWGARNTALIQHPLSRAVPQLSRLLDLPRDALAGDLDLPRVQGPAFGASERFAVSPGREAEGYFQMPGGQSGHPLSPYYRAGHEAWVRGELAPFLPGEPRHTLTLSP